MKFEIEGDEIGIICLTILLLVLVFCLKSCDEYHSVPASTQTNHVEKP